MTVFLLVVLFIIWWFLYYCSTFNQTWVFAYTVPLGHQWHCLLPAGSVCLLLFLVVSEHRKGPVAQSHCPGAEQAQPFIFFSLLVSFGDPGGHSPPQPWAEGDAAALLGELFCLSMESHPGQLCAKNVNNFAAAALHVKSLTFTYFIWSDFFSLFFFFFL